VTTKSATVITISTQLEDENVCSPNGGDGRAAKVRDVRMSWVSILISTFVGFCIGYAMRARRAHREQRPTHADWERQHVSFARARRAF
jgi:hypothetical protein